MSQPVSQPVNATRGRVVRTIDRLSELAGYTSAVLILLTVLVICYAVLLRYIVGASTVWQTELAVYFLIYASFVGAAYGLKHDDHVKVDLVVRRLPPRVREVVRLIAAALGCLLAIGVAGVGVQLWWEVAEAGRRSGTAWNVPLAFPYIILPLGMALLALQYAAVIAGIVRSLKRAAT